MTSAELVRSCRGSWTQDQYAVILGVSQKTISSMESGKVNPSLEMLHKLASTVQGTITIGAESIGIVFRDDAQFIAFMRARQRS